MARPAVSRHHCIRQNVVIVVSKRDGGRYALESRLKRRVLPDNLLYSPFICRAVFLKEIVRVGLGRGFGVGVV